MKEDLFNAIGVDTEQAGVIDSYAVDVVERERAYWIELNQEMICDRREAFETGTQLGRAWNEVQRLRTAEQERLVEGLWGVVDPGAAEQIVRFSVDTVKMTQEIDGETYYRERAGEELNTIIDVICRRR